MVWKVKLFYLICNLSFLLNQKKTFNFVLLLFVDAFNVTFVTITKKNKASSPQPSSSPTHSSKKPQKPHPPPPPQRKGRERSSSCCTTTKHRPRMTSRSRGAIGFMPILAVRLSMDGFGLGPRELRNMDFCLKLMLGLRR
jgi:hypothetical protein